MLDNICNGKGHLSCWEGTDGVRYGLTIIVLGKFRKIKQYNYLKTFAHNQCWQKQNICHISSSQTTHYQIYDSLMMLTNICLLIRISFKNSVWFFFRWVTCSKRNYKVQTQTIYQNFSANKKKKNNERNIEVNVNRKHIYNWGFFYFFG